MTVLRGPATVLVGLLLLFFLSAPDSARAESSQAREALRPVVLQLRWVPQFQFAGYYAALWQGYYADEGLDVRIRPALDSRGEILQPTEEVARGRADFGVGATDILTARDGGADLVVLASIFQHSAAALYVRQGVTDSILETLPALTIRRRPGSLLDVEFQILVAAAGFDPHVIAYPPYAADDFLEGVDGYMGDDLTAPLMLREAGITADVLRSRDLGIDFYGDTLFTRGDLIAHDLSVVEAFTRASLRGWDYALRNPEEIAEQLRQRFPEPQADGRLDGRNTFQIPRVIDLTDWTTTDLGTTSASRWQAMHDALLRFGVVSGDLDATQFVYDLPRIDMEQNRRLRDTLLAGIAVLSILLLSAAAGAWLMHRTMSQRGRTLHLTEESYRLLIDSVRDYAIYALDLDGRVASWSEAAERLSGYGRDEVLNRPFSMFYMPADVTAGVPQRELEAAAALGRAESEGWRVRKDGSRFWANAVLSALRGSDGTLRGYVRVVRDISGRRANEERIRFQAAVLNRVRNAVIATDANGCVVYMNAYAEALFLTPWRDAENRALSALGILPADTAQARLESDRIEREVTARRRDGTTFPALCVSSTSPDPDGTGHSAVYVIHDLTERKRMEAALRHSSNLALLGRMSASLVHEISQPMNVIRLTADGGLMRLDRGQVDGEDLARRLRTISDQAARLFDTIDFMQTFSRADTGIGTGAELGEVDVTACAHNAAGNVAETYARAGVHLDLDVPAAPIHCKGRRRQLEQVLVNLLSNALHAVTGSKDRTTPGRVLLVVAPPDETPGVVRIRVEDDGPGVPQELRETIFQPFYTTKPAGEGTGLGLAISLGIMRAMGGVLDAGESERLGGACFEARLPAAEAPVGPSGHEAPPPLPPPPDPEVADGLGHILVVDDEPLARHGVADFLRNEGWLISEADGGRAAADILAQCNGDGGPGSGPGDGPLPPVDAVVTDIRMPGGSGTELIERILADYPQVFTIVMTGQPLHDRENLETIGSGADIVLRKPISLQELHEHLCGLLQPVDGS